MTDARSVVFDTYSRMAAKYDDDGNVNSCWWQHTDRNVRSIHLRPDYELVADIGCGTGAQLFQLARTVPSTVQFVGVEPAADMRARAVALNKDLPNVRLLAGSFEQIPLPDRSVDYMYSINAFHWAVDPARGVAEAQRVMKPGGTMDHFFIGRDIGREFIRATTPIFMRYMGPKKLLAAAKMRTQFTRDDAEQFWGARLGAGNVAVDEVYETYYDTVEGHLGWWVRIEPQLLAIAADRKAACEAEIRAALAALDRGRGVPYTMHQIHVRARVD
jgi:ubiquinone/menaquinone biosynthesis C-methylase UbiE